MLVPTSRHCRPAYAVARSLILGVSTLAIMGVLFVAYQLSTGVNEPRIAESPPPPPPTKPKHTAPPPDEMPSVSLGDGRTLGPGKRTTYTQYEPGSKRARFEVEASDWLPTGMASDEFRVVKPEIRLRTPDGQFVRVTADEGWIQLAKGTTGSREPIGGRLAGSVAITIDRLSDRERSALPPDERDRPDEARLIHIAFEEITFDLNEARIEAPGPFSLKMAEAELESSGLVLHYNEKNSRIERLEITGAVTGFLRGAGMLFAASKTDEETTVADAPESPKMAQEPESTEPPVSPSDGIPLFAVDEPHQPNDRPTDTYLADVEGGVSIRQTVGGALVLSLASDRLQLLFDFAQAHRDAAQTSGPAPGSGEADETESVEVAGAQNDQPEAHVFFEWSGPFVMRSVDPGSPDDGEPIGQRVRIIASGDKVHFLDRRLDVVCKKIEVHRGTEKVWITGTPDEPVVLSTEQYDDMAAVEVFIDRAEGYVKITGPARLGESSDESSGASADIRFDGLAELTIGKHTIERTDPDTGDIVKTESEYMSGAAFSGSVLMARGSDLISGDTIKMSFGPPTTPGAFAENIRTIDAKGDVTMTRGDDRVSADALSIRLGSTPDGRSMPRQLDAFGHVTVQQGTRTITAGERLTVVMIPMIEPKPAFDMVAARFEAVRRGVDPETVDWQRVRDEYEKEVNYTVGLKTLDARGGVTANDSTGGLDLIADSLACDFMDGGNVDRIRITGPDGQPAHVAFGERSVTAHRINVDLGAEMIDVDGAGEISMVTYRGLDGSISDSPQHVNITWADRMEFRGASNTAKFVGQVRATSRRSHGSSPQSFFARLLTRDAPVTIETSTFEAESLVIDFVDRDVKPTQQSAFGDRWWVFAPLVERFTKPTESPLPRFSKEPVAVVADKNVSIKFTNTDPRTGRVDSRIYLAASRMTVDLTAKLLTAPVSGTLLIENYKISESDQRAANPRSAPFASNLGNLPSQTYIEWADSMSLDATQTRAEFQGDVLLDYRSGMKIALLDELATAYAFVPPGASTAGRHTVMTCKSLVTEFAGAEAQSGGGINVKDIRRFEASGGVYLEDDQFTVIADRIVKHARSDLLAIHGRDGANAEIHSRDGKGPTLQGPQFLYHLNTGRIDAPDIVVHTRR